MKTRNEWVRKNVLREERRKNDRGIVDVIKIIRHFFKKMPEWIEEIKDPRHQSYITYTQDDLLYMGLLKNMCSVESMRQMEHMFNEETCIRTLSILSGNEKLTEMPHSDTLNCYLERLSPECLSELRRKMVKSLIAGKAFTKARLLGTYWRIILDGTGLFYFKERHCENCLRDVRKDENGKQVVRYYHKVLEAKLVLGDGFVISLGTEFIENEKEDVAKQDCELNAAKRLLARIKEEYGRLPVCIQADALYEAEPVMNICREYGWKYIFTHKDTRQCYVGEEYAALGDEEKGIRRNIGKEKGTGKYYNGIEKITGKTEVMNLYEYSYDDIGKDGTPKRVTFYWTTNIELTRENLVEMINAGRGRWQIENEGFNFQKNILYRIEHLNSKNPVAMKNHYLLTQIADIIMQLYLHWNPMVKRLGQGIKNTSSRLLESFRRHTVTDEDVSYIQRRTSVYLE